MALLRGVNVGGKNKVSMADLRELATELGHGDVRTYIQSGNVVFTAAKKVKESDLEAAVAKRFGVTSAVMLRTQAELAKVVERNPFASAEPSSLHVGFMAAPPPRERVAGLDAARFAPEEVGVRGRDVYLHLPNGLGRSKLPGYVDRQLAVPITVRNWNTVNKLLDLASTPT